MLLQDASCVNGGAWILTITKDKQMLATLDELWLNAVCKHWHRYYFNLIQTCADLVMLPAPMYVEIKEADLSLQAWCFCSRICFKLSTVCSGSLTLH